jgi:hypothetical protein
VECGRRRTTDPYWSITTHEVRKAVQSSGAPAVYYLEDGPQRGFVREELMLVPDSTELPPDKILTRYKHRI